MRLFPTGSAWRSFRAPPNARCYRKGVKPDFVMPDGRWVDFKFRVSYRESDGPAWKPSALYSSLRKYIDHIDNEPKTLTIVYKHMHGATADVEFPITRGTTILIPDAREFAERIQFVDVRRIYPSLRKAGLDSLAASIEALR